MSDYQHSAVFSKMKAIKEEISTNLTSYQYLQTLDFFLWKSIVPIADACPNLFLNYLAKIVARQSLKASAKLTSDDRQKLSIHLFNTITSTTHSKLIENAKLMFINRGLLFGFVSMFRNQLKYYEELNSGSTIISSVERTTIAYRIERRIGLRPGGNLHAALKESAYWDDKARWFKSLIVQKYTRMAILQAQSTYKDYNHYVKLDDIIQVYLLVVNRAIDRCDSRQGVLTTFIQNWFKSARSEVASMAEGQLDHSYEELTEIHGDAIHDILGTVKPNIDLELQEQVAYIASIIDPVGLVRTSLGIDQYMSRKNRNILEAFSYEQQPVRDRRQKPRS